MKTKLAINGGDPTVSSDKARFNWPRITAASEQAVLDQLHTTISIYNRSGIIQEFEDAFCDYHGRKYGLLSNSGTSAIFSMFEAINLQPGDEVLCPVYTFHASVSPMMYIGAVPVFCDSDEFGNISLESIKAKVTDKTKAVVVTHMWGVPAKDSAKIQEFCKERGLWLLEDCSHAHGASLHGQKVGTFGDAASWSLQGQKIITGGEGGIMLTDNKDLYSRALIQGHYNKRPLQELDDDSELKAYSLTGLGLKLRAHPLAIALAMQQFLQLDEFIEQKQKYALMLNEAFAGYEFLKTPVIEEDTQNSWYAYNLMYDASAAHGVTREQFAEALQAEGLAEVDIPGSTGLLNNLPLFTDPSKVLPRFYSQPLQQQSSFPNAEVFYNSIIKLPVWAFKDDSDIVQAYIDGIKRVADYLQEYRTLKAA
jgi:perosamine synthetase